MKTDIILPGDISKWVPPDPIPNSEVKPFSANDSVDFIHAKVGHRQAFIPKESSLTSGDSFNVIYWATMPIIKSNGADFYYELHGSGDPVILIAGYACDHLIWMPVLGELSKYYRVLIFDNRGVGQTTDDHRLLSAELMAQDVMALAKQLQFNKPHIVGQSMGGTIAQNVASYYPDDINKLAIVTSSAKWRQAMLRGLKATILMRQQNIDFDLILETLIPQIFGEAFLSNQKTVTAFKKLMLDNPYPQSLIDQVRQFEVLENFDGREQLKQINVPTLIVHGKQDIISLFDESEYMANQIPQAHLITLDCAHGITLEVPQKLTEVLINFLH